MMQGVHQEPVSYIAEFRQLAHENDLNKHRIEIYLTDGNRHWVKLISEEWEDAIRIVAENDTKPVILMKHTIQSMGLVLRPVERKRDG
ncbi:hypothetical protein QIH85_23895 [Bradyrhizobium japonicum]|uniref:hypothetical protein n=1 Tax=Bradyrhizobium japonicum TaxID=375 RepID=UPI002714F244|nr:hypothetical protein [Bradyrhizobium japonicum]WLB24926.1 hypothetical protein QIH85_23895 [Bradyrhizobium japonicum]